jgi:mycothiol synthase
MSPKTAPYVVRSPKHQDAARVLALQIACDLAEYGDLDSTLDDLLHEWQTLDLGQDAWLVFAGETLLGYGAFSGTGRTPHADFYVHPAQREDGVRRLLLEAIVTRAREVAAGAGSAPFWLRTIIPDVNTRDIEAAAAAGFTPIKQYYRMQIELLDPPPPANPPPGVTTRTMQPDHDDRAVYDLINRAFSAIGQPERPFDDWQSYMMRADHFDPTLWFLAEADGELAGVALCYDYDTHGWVRQLAVAPHFQGRRIGSMLLRQAFHEFHARDCLTIALGVDSENPGAIAFYERLNMVRVRAYEEYGLRLR